MTTVNDLITSAFRKAGIITMQETLSANAANRGLDALNQMLESWAADSIGVYARTWESFSITAGKSSYAIGPSAADFNTVRPVNIATAYFRLGNVDFPMKKIDDEIYNNQIMVKSISAIPKYFNYDNAFPIANLRFWPTPAAAYTLFLLSEKPLTDYALTDTVSLPPGWERAIIFNMADEICGDYGQDTPQPVLRTAQKSLALIRKQIMKQRSLDRYPQGVSNNNIYTGWFT